MKVISIGDLVTDYYYKDGKLLGICGGMTAHNIVANLSKMKVETSVIGVVGNDEAGKIAIRSLKDLGVDVNNIEIKTGMNTRCFHVSYFEDNGKYSFTSKKRCPICQKKRWYEESQINVSKSLKKIEKNDILVFDNLNPINQEIISKTTNNKMLDLGQYFELESYNDDVIQKIFTCNFAIINLNERVEKYFKERFNLKDLQQIYAFLKPKLLIVTRGKNGADFVLNEKVINENLVTISDENDSTGAGDAFFATFIYNYIKNNIIDENFIHNSFIMANKITCKVVKKMGARGHLNNLYKIKKIDNYCTCENFLTIERKKMKRCNINVNNLSIRTLNALNSNAYFKLSKINFNKLNNVAFIGTGGSYAGTVFSSKILNQMYSINPITFYPRDFYYHNNEKFDLVIMFSYSGTTNDIINSVSNIGDDKKIIITKGEISDIVIKTKISGSNIFSYRTSSNKTKERGFLAFEGAIVPASLFFKLYLNSINKDANEIIKKMFIYWNNYFEDYFKDNNKRLKDILKIGNNLNIFMGDYSYTGALDLESKLTESGLFNIILHEKKNFSHGRFINYENMNNKNNIYFCQKNISPYEKKLLDYLKKGHNIIIQSNYNDLISDFDLLIASQYFAYYIANYLNVDISKPLYSENALKIYFYNGQL
jgi:sugar/nucleoside kinase (ribokinase family)